MMDTTLATRRTATVAAMLLAVALTMAACKKSGDEAKAAGADDIAAVTVGPENVAVVAMKKIETGPEMSGSLEPDREATIRAEVSGAVLQTLADQGTRVAAGAVLARLDDTGFRDAYLSARSGMTSAQSGADLARREADRAEKLLAAGAIADRDAENARRANIAAQSQLADAKARLTQAEKQLEKTTVKAPISGIVSVRNVSAGDLASPGTALFTIVDPSSMRLEGSVPTDQMSAVRLGMPVTFTVQGYPGRDFTGRVTRINPVADPTTRQVRILASIPNAGGTLVGGLFAEGRVSSESHSGLVVPITAVDQKGFAPTATRVKNGKAEKVSVRLGLEDPATETIEVLSGLAQGDTVLTGGVLGTTPGTPIRVRKTTDQASAQVLQPVVR
jgi:membrane fusion protein (multidrug efflux system)